MRCEDCKIEIEGFGELFKELEELSKELEEITPIIGDVIEFLILENYSLLLKAKSPLFRLLLQIYRQQFDIALLLHEKYKVHKTTIPHS